MSFLGNKWSGFGEEIGISVILTFAFYLLMYISGATDGHSIGDFGICDYGRYDENYEMGYCV